MKENDGDFDFWTALGVTVAFALGYFLSVISIPSLPPSNLATDQAGQTSYMVASSVCGVIDFFGVIMMVMSLWVGYLRIQAKGRREAGRRIVISGMVIIWLSPLYQGTVPAFEQQNPYTQMIIAWWFMHTIACVVGGYQTIYKEWRSDSARSPISAFDQAPQMDSSTIDILNRIRLGKTVRINSIPWQKRADGYIFYGSILFGAVGLYRYGLISGDVPLWWSCGLILVMIVEQLFPKYVVMDKDGISLVERSRQTIQWIDIKQIHIGIVHMKGYVSAYSKSGGKLLYIQSENGNIIELILHDRLESIATVSSHLSGKPVHVITGDEADKNPSQAGNNVPMEEAKANIEPEAMSTSAPSIAFHPKCARCKKVFPKNTTYVKIAETGLTFCPGCWQMLNRIDLGNNVADALAITCLVIICVGVFGSWAPVEIAKATTIGVIGRGFAAAATVGMFGARRKEKFEIATLFAFLGFILIAYLPSWLSPEDVSWARNFSKWTWTGWGYKMALQGMLLALVAFLSLSIFQAIIKIEKRIVASNATVSQK